MEILIKPIYNKEAPPRDAAFFCAI